jgi:hypothetical protein
LNSNQTFLVPAHASTLSIIAGSICLLASAICSGVNPCVSEGFGVEVGGGVGLDGGLVGALLKN